MCVDNGCVSVSRSGRTEVALRTDRSSYFLMFREEKCVFSLASSAIFLFAIIQLDNCKFLKGISCYERPAMRL